MSLSPATFETLVPGRYLTFTIPSPSPTPTHTHLQISVLDSPTTAVTATTAAMLIPANREQDWIFTTYSGILQLLLASPGISRLILIANYTAHDAASLHEKLKPFLFGFSVKDRKFEVPILSYEDNVVNCAVVEVCVGRVVGDMLVEDVEVHGEGGKREFRRRLRFKRSPNLVQTEVRLDCDCGSVNFRPNVEALVHPYLEPMVASLRLIVGCLGERDGIRPRALCVGVGGGAMVSFLRRRFGFEVNGVEVDEEVLRVGREYFGLEDEGVVPIFIGDAVDVIEELAKRVNRRDVGSFGCGEGQGTGWSSNGNDGIIKYDVILVDLDSSDAISGISAPPLEFIGKHVLLAVKALLYDHGILAINVIPPTRMFYERLKCDFHAVFPDLYEIDVGNGENFVLIAAASPVVSSRSDPEDPFLAKLRSVISQTYIDSIKKIEVWDQGGSANF